MPPAVNDILRVAARLNVPTNGDFVNVFHFRKDTAFGVTDGDAVFDMAGILDTLYNVMNLSISSVANYEDINVFNVTQSTPYGSTPWPTLTAGGGAGDMLPAQNAAFVRGLSGFSRNWARKFFGPFTEGVNTPPGVIDTTTMGRLVNLGAEWLSTTFATPIDNWTPVVFYTALNAFVPITSVAVTNVWATIRRRRLGRGA